MLVAHDLVQVFQIGWAVLHQRAGMAAARGLADALKAVRSRDRDLQIGLTRLRAELTRQTEAGTPWRAQPLLEVIASLDLPAWAALRGLFGECPVMTSVLAGSREASPHRVSATALEFISERAQIETIEAERGAALAASAGRRRALMMVPMVLLAIPTLIAFILTPFLFKLFGWYG